MDLKLKDLADLFQVSEKTIYRWIAEKKIPAYKISHQYRFDKNEIQDWILKNKTPAAERTLSANDAHPPLSLLELLKKGGVFYRIEGGSIEEVIRNSVAVIPTPPALDKELLIRAILERERLMSTAIGKGIAIPHSRDPLVSHPEHQSLSVCFLNHTLDYGSLDGEPVCALFFILSANPKRHLEILYRILHLCQQPEFIALLKQQPLRGEILAYVEAREAEWSKIG